MSGRFLVGWLLVGCSLAQVPQTPDVLVRAGTHFRIEVHTGKLPPELTVRLADEALKAAESAWPVLEKLLAVRSGKPCTIHLHVDADGFRIVETSEWTEISEVKAEIAAGRKFDVAIEVAKARLCVLLDGREVLSWACDGRDMHGAWSLATGDTIAWIEGLKIEPLVGPKK